MSDLDDEVDRFEEKGQLREAVEAQRAVIRAHGSATPEVDRGNDYERLGGLLVDCYDTESGLHGYERGPTRLLVQADEAFRVAHAWYVDVAGPSSADALETLSARLEVAVARGRIQESFEHADALAEAVSSFDGSKSERSMAIGSVRRAIGCALGASMRPVVAKLARAGSELTGEAVLSREVATQTGPPELVFEQVPKRKTSRAAVGELPFFERYWIENRGGPCEGVEVTLHGAAVEQGLLGRAKARITRRGAKARVCHGTLEPRGLVLRSPLSPGAAVNNERTLREIGSFGSELDDALGAAQLTVELEVEALERGKADVYVSITPVGHHERGVQDSLRLTVVRPRKGRAPTEAPRSKPAPPTGPIRRKGTARLGAAIPLPGPSTLLHSLTAIFERAEREPDTNIELRRRLAALPETTRAVLQEVLRREDVALDELRRALGFEPDAIVAAVVELREWVEAFDWKKWTADQRRTPHRCRADA